MTMQHDDELDINGTCLQGYLPPTSYARLVECFGEPNREGSADGKIDAQWVVQTPAGVASIYNYKDGPNYLGEEGTPVEEITDWHIGGHDSSVLGPVRKAVYGDA